LTNDIAVGLEGEQGRRSADRPLWRFAPLLAPAGLATRRPRFRLSRPPRGGGDDDLSDDAAGTPPEHRDLARARPSLGSCARLLQGQADELATDLSLGVLDSSAYDWLLETVATGFFLALYFTTVSAIATSIYVSVPSFAVDRSTGRTGEEISRNAVVYQ
jgi:hypothetical protein